MKAKIIFNISLMAASSAISIKIVYNLQRFIFIKRFLIDIADEAAINEIFNIILPLILFIYYEVTGYFFYHMPQTCHKRS